MSTIASPNCHSVHFDQQQQKQHNKRRMYSSSIKMRSQRAAVSPQAPPPHLSPSSRDRNLCWCCIRRPDKALPSPPPSAARGGASPVMVTMGGNDDEQSGDGTARATTTTMAPVELCALKLTELQNRQRKQKKTRSSTFSVSSATRGIFPRLHRSLSSQQQHKLFRTNPAPPAPPLDLRSLDAADGTPSNTTDYLEVGRAEGGWMRDPNFWRRQQQFWQMQTVQPPLNAATVVGASAQFVNEWDEEAVGEYQQQQQMLAMETARTSRTEDIAHYPSMDTLIDEILLMDGDEGKRDDFKQYINGSTGRNSGREEQRGGSGLEAVMPSNASSPASSAGGSTRCDRRPAALAQPLLTSAGAVVAPFQPASVFFTNNSDHLLVVPSGNNGCATSAYGAAAGGIAHHQQCAVVAVPPLPHPPLGVLPALTQSLFEVLAVTYIWVASSLALLVQWFLW